jgi:hypothetical protein
VGDYRGVVLMRGLHGSGRDLANGGQTRRFSGQVLRRASVRPSGFPVLEPVLVLVSYLKNG